MSEAGPEPVYAVDSSSVMDWQERSYPLDVFAVLLEQIEALILAGRFIAPAIVREELENVGTTGLNEWMTQHRTMFIPTASVADDAQRIQRQFTGLADPKAEHEEADAFVIALARNRGGIVVTQETAASQKRNPKRTHYIPDVCRELGIPCISLLGLIVVKAGSSSAP